MTVLVTGAGGFLGAHVVRLLLEAGHRPRAMVRPGRPRAHLESAGVELVEGDLQDERSLAEACRGARGLVHCAARIGFARRGDEDQRRTNVEGTAALFRAAHRRGVERIVHVSSVAAVGASRSPVALDEDAVWNLRRLGVHYAMTKRAAEERALAAARGGMPIVVVNPGAMFGPRLDGGPPNSLLARIAAGKLRWIPTGGTSVTDVADVGAAILAALECGRVGERYILAGHDLTWEQLYRRMAEVTQGSMPTRRLSVPLARLLAPGASWLELAGVGRAAGLASRLAAVGWYAWYDSSKARRELGYRVRPVEEILARAWPKGGARP